MADKRPVGLLDTLLSLVESRQVARPRGLQIIGAGFGRTGTKSLTSALERLGHKVYDLSAMVVHGTEPWVEAARHINRSGNFTLLDLQITHLEDLGYTVTLDTPMNLFAHLLAQLRPHAKVLVSVRGSTDEWLKSWVGTAWILNTLYLRPWIWWCDLRFIGELAEILHGFSWEWSSFPDSAKRLLPWYEVATSLPAFDSPAKLQRWKDFHDGIRQNIEGSLPKERFFVFQVTMGWEPLLNFLGVEDDKLASEPFPHVNERKGLERRRVVMDVVAIGLPFWPLLLLALLSVCARRCCQGASHAKRKRE